MEESTKNSNGSELLLYLLQMANNTAIKNNYSLKEKNVSITKNDGVWKVYYSKIPKLGKGVVGGDYTVLITADLLKVERVEKGR